MSTNQTSLFTTQVNSRPPQSASDPGVQTMQQGFENAMAFQAWVSEQAQTLGRMKVFHTMAKQINDQQ